MSSNLIKFSRKLQESLTSDELHETGSHIILTFSWRDYHIFVDGYSTSPTHPKKKKKQKTKTISIQLFNIHIQLFPANIPSYNLTKLRILPKEQNFSWNHSKTDFLRSQSNPVKGNQQNLKLLLPKSHVLTKGDELKT